MDISFRIKTKIHKFSDFSLISDFRFDYSGNEISSLEDVSHDFMVDSNFRKSNFRLFHLT